jgi:hypothetical protein
MEINKDGLEIKKVGAAGKIFSAAVGFFKIGIGR